MHVYMRVHRKPHRRISHHAFAPSPLPCVFIYMHMYAHIYTYTYLHIYIHSHVYTCVSMSTSIDAFMSMAGFRMNDRGSVAALAPWGLL